MPVFKPSILISDAYGSTKDLTWFHRGGKCFVKKHSASAYVLTPAREEYLAVHRRALAAWRKQPNDIQHLWNEYGCMAISHRPPYDKTAHISGQNLFVSAYHGFYTLGDEHVPEALPFGPFPVLSMEFAAAEESGNGTLLLRFRSYCSGTGTPERYRILMKLQLTHPGGGRRPSLFRNVLANACCSREDGEVVFVIPGYREKWRLDALSGYGAHCRYIVLDTVTGYRDQYRDYDFQFNLPQH